jgi:hypothetical protein
MGVVINEGHKIPLAMLSLCTHWPKYVRVDFVHFRLAPITLLIYYGAFSDFSKQTCFAHRVAEAGWDGMPLDFENSAHFVKSYVSQIFVQLCEDVCGRLCMVDNVVPFPGEDDEGDALIHRVHPDCCSTGQLHFQP